MAINALCSGLVLAHPLEGRKTVERSTHHHVEDHQVIPVSGARSLEKLQCGFPRRGGVYRIAELAEDALRRAQLDRFVVDDQDPFGAPDGPTRRNAGQH